MESFGINSFSEKDIIQWFESNALDEAIQWFKWGCHELDALFSRSNQNCLDVFLCTESTAKWLGLSFSCILRKQRVWFISPNWRNSEWSQLSEIIHPQLLWADSPIPLSLISVDEEGEEAKLPGIMIPTGGSSGALKFAWHTVESMTHAVQGMVGFFLGRALQRGDFTYSCELPLWHVSGWMQAYRSFLSDSRWNLMLLNREESFLKWMSVVPTQLNRILRSGNESNLKQIDFVVVGGGACPKMILDMAIQKGVTLWITYGMTETAGMVAGKRVSCDDDLVKGARIFPHADIIIEPFDDGNFLQNTGEIKVSSKSMCRGFNGQCFRKDNERFYLATKDLGYFDHSKGFHIVGRLDTVLNSGGEKVLPIEVENMMRAHSMITDCLVSGMKDPDWGNKIVCVYSTEDGQSIPDETLKAYARERISPYKIPKIWKHVQAISYNEKGKLSSDFKRKLGLA